MTELKIYEISDALMDALDNVRVDEETGEIVGMDEVNDVKVSAETKIVATAKYIATREALCNAMYAAERSISARKKAETRRLDFLKDQIIKGMQSLDSRLIEAPDVAIQVHQNPESVSIFDESQIPSEFCKTETITTIDKAAIKTALKSGRDVPGARLIRTQKLVIK